MTSIGKYAFRYCTNLKSIEIPNSVTDIGYGAFWNCSAITDIKVEWEKPVDLDLDDVFDSTTYQNAVLNLPQNAWINYVMDYYWSEFKNISCGDLGVTDYSDGTYFYRYLPSSGFTVLVSNSSYKNFSSISIPQRISAEGSFYSIFGIAPKAFYNCTNAKGNLVIPNGCEKIGRDAFYKCSQLSSVTIPVSLKEIGRGAFEGCTGLSQVDISDLTAWCDIDFYDNYSNPLDYAKHLYLNGDKIVNLRIPEGVKKLKPNVFYYGSISSVEISNSVEEIGSNAFAFSNISSVRIPSNLNILSGNAFNSCKNIKTITFNQSDNPLTLTDTDVFRGTSIETFNLERDLILAQGATAGMKTLKKVNFGGNVTLIGDGLFNGNSNLKEIVIPSTVTYIGASAFENCGLTSISIGSAIEEIGDKAFAGNTPSAIAITAVDSPDAFNTTFSNINGKLMVTPGSEDNYFNNPNCWYQFNYPTPLVVATDLKVNSSKDSNGNVKLTGTISPADVSLPYVIWKSADINSALIDPDGTVHFINGSSSGRLVATTLYADGPVVTVDVTNNGNITSVENGDAGVDGITTDFDDTYRVFSIQGINLMNTSDSEDLKKLHPGLYIINGKKVMIGK